MATIRDVARVARVSTATVSATINSSARVSDVLQQRVWDAIRSTGYSPSSVARSLKRGRTETIGLIISDITNPFFGAVARSLEATARTRGYTVILCNTDEDREHEMAYLKLMRRQRADGLVVSLVGGDDAYAETVRRELEGPVVLIDRTLPGIDMDCVVIDNLAAARKAVEHIISFGHRRIGILAGYPWVTTSAQRIEGYRQTLVTHGIEVDPALIKTVAFRKNDAYEAAYALLTGPGRPTAIFSADNTMTVGLMTAISDAGFTCPRDVSVACVDDFEWASAFRPRLTTVAQPTARIGVHACNLLLDRLQDGAENSPQARRIVLQPDLIVRDSCAAPSDGA